MQQKFPYEVRYVLTAPFIGIFVYKQLRRVLSDDQVKMIAMNFNSYIEAKNNHNTISEFLEYGEKYINPILNEKLRREPNHPTFIKLVEYSISNYIERDSGVNWERINRGLPHYKYGEQLIYDY